jgi:antitoxin component YwqK of YwqJK toxin-antitoxin module
MMMVGLNLKKCTLCDKGGALNSISFRLIDFKNKFMLTNILTKFRFTYHNNGFKKTEEQYRSGKLNKKQTSWHDDGQIEALAIYKDGVCIEGDCDFFGFLNQ